VPPVLALARAPGPGAGPWPWRGLWLWRGPWLWHSTSPGFPVPVALALARFPAFI